MDLKPGKYLLTGDPDSGKTRALAKIVLDSKIKIHVIGESVWKKLDLVPQDIFVEFLRAAWQELDFLLYAFDPEHRIWLVENGTFIFLSYPLFPLIGNYRDMAIPVIRANLERYHKIIYCRSPKEVPVIYDPFDFIDWVLPKHCEIPST